LIAVSDGSVNLIPSLKLEYFGIPVSLKILVFVAARLISHSEENDAVFAQVGLFSSF
jgi:hypothetical protein